VVEHLPSKHRALSSNFSTEKKAYAEERYFKGTFSKTMIAGVHGESFGK
jgi:hypothetical protein